MFTLLLLMATAMADEPVERDSEGRQIIYKQKTEIDFEGLDIEGELIKPQGALLLERKKASFNPLIKLRRDFNVEMSESVREIQ
jgi:hypothetical protein